MSSPQPSDRIKATHPHTGHAKKTDILAELLRNEHTGETRGSDKSGSHQDVDVISNLDNRGGDLIRGTRRIFKTVQELKPACLKVNDSLTDRRHKLREESINFICLIFERIQNLLGCDLTFSTKLSQLSSSDSHLFGDDVGDER